MPDPSDFLAAETRALLVRVEALKPFVLQETMLPAAVLLPGALIGVEKLLLRERAKLRRLGRAFLSWLAGPGRAAPATEAQRRFTTLRLRLNEHLAQLDLFSDAITQRSESAVGTWLSGMDVAAGDALRLNDGIASEAVPIICYLDRGPGAAIRRARTRLPGEATNPVAIIRIPRERMVGHGIASSLFHEVGHQGAALLDLVPALRAELLDRAGSAPVSERLPWRCWATWISEITADFWSVAKLGIGSTLGLMGVVSLPRPFVFRFTLDDPHPFPWIRVMVSATIGDTLYPSPQWSQLRRLWLRLYPLSGAEPEVAEVIGHLAPTIPALARLLAGHTPAGLRGTTLADALAHPSRHPEPLRRLFGACVTRPDLTADVRPALRFAVLGQARWDGRLTARQESRAVSRMLTGWAMRSTLRMAAAHSNPQLQPAGAAG
ncbi:MAG TPA: hypothetical protein VFV67_23675 [Actinophytocola sp.]|uniref:hypothetical protein n=1 Tax=Actinophytocola sp. TaxID=1872138 RepID=UPI002DBAC9F5|nr:hypothetical protein [Actinophytocola sp.]HEU5473658.1 hypothetical protein [Actinophytocola sp.]